ncbi:MAG: magnesium transporter [Gammaproteobacteria bacterium]|jgi:magnesium transporter|nr:magnesium transporter [Gammaproteobacteria bacterium]
MENPGNKNKLQHKVTQVHDLLRKHRLTEQLAHKDDSPRKALLENIVHRQNLAELDQHLALMHAADLAQIIEMLPPDDRQLVWSRVIERCGGEVLLEVSDAVRLSLINNMSQQQLQLALEQMDGDDLAYIADDIPEQLLSERLESLSHEDRNWIRESQNYVEGSVGDLMSNEMVIVRAADTLEQAEQKLRGLHELPIHNDKLFVVDKRGVFKGVLPLESILLNDPGEFVADVMQPDVSRFTPDDDASESAMAFERYDLVSAPVVNARGKLVGRLTVDVVMDYLRRTTNEDVLNMAGLEKDEDLFSPLMDSVKNRGVWLVINLFTAFIASRVIGIFEDTIVQLVALAALMPIIASVGGNTGNQTSALIIRAMSRGQITDENTAHLFRKEVGVSTINGLALGTAVGFFALVFYGDIALALVIAVAMLLTLVVAAVLGMTVPVLIDRYGRDPALGTSVILTATTDSIGFFIFLGLAALFLV